MEYLLFIKQYIIKPWTVGAILPSSENLANRMVEGICFEKARYIVEFGPGTGVFTQKLVENKKKDTVVLLIENNYEFYKLLKDKYEKEENLFIVNDSAANVDKYMREYNIPHVDCIISGLPFASLPKDVSANILDKTREILKKGGKFNTFQYTLMKRKLISKYFNRIEVKREFRNIPPAYVLSCSNEK